MQISIPPSIVVLYRSDLLSRHISDWYLKVKTLVGNIIKWLNAEKLKGQTEVIHQFGKNKVHIGLKVLDINQDSFYSLSLPSGSSLKVNSSRKRFFGKIFLLKYA